MRGQRVGVGHWGRPAEVVGDARPLEASGGKGEGSLSRRGIDKYRLAVVFLETKIEDKRGNCNLLLGRKIDYHEVLME